MCNLSAKKIKGLIALLLLFFCSLLLSLDTAKAQALIGGQQPFGAPGFGCVKLPMFTGYWPGQYEIVDVRYQLPIGNQAPGQNLSPQIDTERISCWKRFDGFNPTDIRVRLFYNTPSSAGRLPSGWRSLKRSVIEHFKDYLVLDFEL